VFGKSEEPQSVSRYTPFTNKTWNSLNDINNGVYSNSTGLTLLQFDCSSIYNSNAFISEDLFLTIPIVMVAECSTNAGVTLAANPSAFSLLALKQGFHHLVHQVEVQNNGRTVNEISPFANIASNFKMLSSMTQNDLKNFGASMGMAEVLDSPSSVYWNTTTTPVVAPTTLQSGVGLCNNIAFAGSITSSADQTIVGGQNVGCSNVALAKRIARTTSTSSNTTNMYASTQAATGSQPFIATAQTLLNEFRPYFQILASGGTPAVQGRMVWYDVAILPLRMLCNFFDKMPLCKKLDLQLRIYLNTGSLAVGVLANTTAATTSLGQALNNVGQYTSIQSSTFANTCPFTVNWMAASQGAASTSGIPTGTTYIAAGCFVQNSPNTNITCATSTAGINLGGVRHPMPSCRLYYSQVELSPTRAVSYITENRAKEIVWEQYIFNQYNAIQPNAQFSQLISSGVRNPVGILIQPFISSSQPTTVNGATPLNFTQYGNCFDTAPATSAPLSLTNLSVLLGGRNVLGGASLFYTFENFLEQIALCETSVPELSLNQGVVDQKWYENNRTYYIDLARGSEADKATMRNLSISFTNNSGVAIDILVFTFYLSRGVIDVETGIMTM